MKHTGCILEFTQHRNKELIRAYREVMNNSGYIDIEKISREIVNSPCERFWVSEERATVVVSAMTKGRNILKAMRPTKREMFREIYKRVKKLRKTDKKSALSWLVAKVVNSPAPKFYMKPRCAMEIIYKIKRGFYE